MDNEKNKEKEIDNKKQNQLKNNNPVIIRREVIVKNAEKGKEIEEKKPNIPKREVGFIETERKKDYNIVYRNKPTKPLTASELFGMNKPIKKEEPEIKNDVQKFETKEIKPEIKNDRPNKQDLNRTFNNSNNKTAYNNNQNNNIKKQYPDRPNTYRRFDNNYSNNNNNNNIGNTNSNNTNSRFNNQNRGPYNPNNQFKPRTPRPLDDRGIEKNIKDIMSLDVIEKENTREYYNKSIDKEKNIKYEEAKINKKASKTKKTENDINSRKLKDLKQTNRLSNMFEEGSMLDYYDLTTARGRRNKKRLNLNEERTKQKIFQLEQIEIPETTTVKELSTELKKTSGEIIKKLLNYGIMATINNEIDYDTAFLIASEFGINAKKKEVITDEDILFDDSEDSPEDLKPRPPVVVVMGHVDHR